MLYSASVLVPGWDTTVVEGQRRMVKGGTYCTVEKRCERLRSVPVLWSFFVTRLEPRALNGTIPSLCFLRWELTPRATSSFDTVEAAGIIPTSLPFRPARFGSGLRMPLRLCTVRVAIWARCARRFLVPVRLHPRPSLPQAQAANSPDRKSVV